MYKTSLGGKIMKVLKVIFGIISIILATFLLQAPFITELVFVFVLTVYAGVVGIVTLVDYFANRKSRTHSVIEGAVGGSVVAVSIIAIVLMLLSIFIEGFSFSIAYLGAFFLIVAVLVYGIMTVVGAFTYRALDGGMKALSVVFGILVIIAASTAFAFIPVIIGALGIFTSIGIMISGVSLIISAFESNDRV